MPTPLSKHLAFAVKGEPLPPENVRLHSLNTRVPYRLLASIDIMCQRSGKSRNAICNDLLAIGVAEVLSHFDDEEKADFQSIQEETVHGYLVEDVHQESEAEHWGVR